MVDAYQKKQVHGRGDLLVRAMSSTSNGDKQTEKITDQVFLHRRGSRGNILASSLKSSERRRSSKGLISNLISKMFFMQELSALEVAEKGSLHSGALEMQKKGNNTWFSVHCILDKEAHLYIFESAQSLRSIQICPLEHATINGAPPNLSNSSTIPPFWWLTQRSRVHPIPDMLRIIRSHCYMHTCLLDHATISDVTHSKTFMNLQCQIFTADSSTINV